jgi:hypothetical protein
VAVALNPREQIERYRQQMGDEATMRQIIAAENRYNCCGTFRFEGHHPDCPDHPKKRAEKSYRKHFGDKIG